ncbi:MAG: AAC(3) family N-acetyltransferase [Candidatus Scalinduaceae bacterium]
MVRKLANSLKMHRIVGYLNRKTLWHFNKVSCRVNREMLVDSFRSIGLERGAIVCVHSSLSRLGYVEGGAEAVIDALIETVGTEGCIMMPSFPMTRSMAQHLNRQIPFDVRSSPSRSGIVSEVFRGRPGVLRSLHPTNPVSVWGRNAEELVRDHEKSPTPYGSNTPYGKLAEREDSFIIMLETHVHSLLHHLQERVHFPNLFLPEEKEASFIDMMGRRRTMRTKVMRPRVPYFIAIPSVSSTKPDWALLHDYALMFPRRRERVVRRLGYRFDGYQRLYRRRAELEHAGILRSTRVGKGEIGLLHVKRFLARIEPELLELIERFRNFYNSERIKALCLPYS